MHAFIGTPPGSSTLAAGDAARMAHREPTAAFAGGNVSREPVAGEPSSTHPPMRDMHRDQVFGASNMSNLPPLGKGSSAEAPTFRTEPSMVTSSPSRIASPRLMPIQLNQEPVALAASPPSRTASPRLMPSQLSQDKPAVAQRAAEWERQIESLDQKEMEIHQTQLRLIREQTAAFRGDLLGLRQELAELRARDDERAVGAVVQKQGLDKCVQEIEVVWSRLEQMHGSLTDHHSLLSQQPTMHEQVRRLSDATEQQGQSLREAHLRLEAALESRQEAINERLGYFADTLDGHRKDVEELRVSNAKELGWLKSSRDISSVTERIGHLEDVLCGYSEKHAQDLSSAHNRLEQMQGRISIAEAYGPAIESLKKSHAAVAKEKTDLNSGLNLAHERVDQLQERTDQLERLLYDVADKRAKEIEEIGVSHRALVSQTQDRDTSFNDVRDRLEQLMKSHEHMLGSHSAVDVRVNGLECALSDTSDKQAMEIASLKAAQAKHATEGRARDVMHSSIGDRLTQLEKFITETSEKCEQELQGAHSRLEQVHGRIQEERRARELHHNATRDHLTAEKEKRDMQAACLEERIATVTDCTDKHLRDLEGLKAAHSRHLEHTKSFHTRHATIEERLDYIESWFQGFKPR